MRKGKRAQGLTSAFGKIEIDRLPIVCQGSSRRRYQRRAHCADVKYADKGELAQSANEGSVGWAEVRRREGRLRRSVSSSEHAMS